MRTVVKNSLVVLMAMACMAPSMAVNAVHQFTHTPGPLAWPLAGAAILSVLLAGCAPFAMRRAKQERDVGLRLIAWVAFIVCASYNLASAVGAASTARSDVAGARTADNARAALLTGQLAQAEKSRAALASASGEQTPGMLDNALSALRNDARWTRSKGCADATLPDSRTFCIEHAQKLAARDAAAKVAELDRDITAIKAQLLAATGAMAGQPADPQADNIANALSLVGAVASVGKIGMSLNLWFALTIEVLGSLGPVVFASVFRQRQALVLPQPATPVKPDSIPAVGHAVEPFEASKEDERPNGGPDQAFARLRIVSSGDPIKLAAPEPGSVSAWLASATIDAPGSELRGSDAFRAYRRNVGGAAETTSASQFRKLVSKALGRQRRAQIITRNSGFVIRDIALKSANVGGDVGGDVDADVGEKADPTLT